MDPRDDERVCTGEAMHAHGPGGPGDPYTPDGGDRFMTAFGAYPSEDSARHAMLAYGTAAERWLLVGRALHDTRREPVGGFAGPVAPDGLVGSYANRPLERRRGCGSFAGDADEMRQGSFADTDRVVIVRQNGDAERSRVTGERGVRKLLRRTTLNDDAIQRAIGELRAGHTVLVVDSRQMKPTDAAAEFEQVREAA
jgi:hypothetical protein